MKKSILSFVLAGLGSAPLFAQKPGDSVTPDALGKIEWIRGAAPEAWEPGKVYLLECWATWCGPCIAAIPHIDALHDKYASKGLHVIGVNVWEDGKDKVADFVKEKGDGMSYDIAYTGKGGAFETEWLKPAEVTGIPRAIVVKDGKVALSTHPSRLTESVIEGLLEGGEAQEKAIASISEAEALQQKSVGIMRSFREAAAKKDLPAMEEQIAGLKALDASNRMLSQMHLDLHLAKEDWPAIEETLQGIDSESERSLAAYNLSRHAAALEKAPASLQSEIAGGLEKLLIRGGGPTEWQSLSRLRWAAGDKEKSLAAAEKAAELVKDERFVKAGFPAAPYERFAAALKEGEMPDRETFGAWIKEAKASRE